MGWAGGVVTHLEMAAKPNCVGVFIHKIGGIKGNAIGNEAE